MPLPSLKLTTYAPENRKWQKRTCHFPTINFEGRKCEFQGGYINHEPPMGSHKHCYIYQLIYHKNHPRRVVYPMIHKILYIQTVVGLGIFPNKRRKLVSASMMSMLPKAHRGGKAFPADDTRIFCDRTMESRRLER